MPERFIIRSFLAKSALSLEEIAQELAARVG
jgi:hypothetical protein